MLTNAYMDANNDLDVGKKGNKINIKAEIFLFFHISSFQSFKPTHPFTQYP